MSDISVLGLGLMGGALARTLQYAGHQLTVWNRSVEKTKPLVANGAMGAFSAASAVAASPVVLVCVDNYAVTRNLLAAEDVAPHLSGRTLVQLSTGSPREAQDAAAWFNERSVTYFDGAILVLPDAIGSKDAQILLAGPEGAFGRIEPLLKCLAGDLRYLGENIRAPATLDLAFLSQRIGQLLGAIHGVNLCESEEVGADLYATLFAEGNRVRTLSRVIHDNDYHNPSVTVRVWDVVLQRIQRQAQDAAINTEVPDFAAGILKRAISLGHGDEDVAAIIKVLRGV